MEAARALEREVFSRFGIPESIHSDMDMAFQGNLFKAVAKMLNIPTTGTTGYNPKGNAQVCLGIPTVISK